MASSSKLALFKVFPGYWYSLIALLLGILLSQMIEANSSLFRAKVSHYIF